MSDLATAATDLAGREVDPRSGVLAARRLTPPKWRDARLVLGLLMLLGSVVAGARIVGAADHTVSLLAAASDLPAGHILQPTDLSTLRARVVGPAAIYLAAEQGPAIMGRRLSRPIGRGELLANSAVGGNVDPASFRDVPIVVDSLRLPRLRAGDLVDVIATFKPNSPGQAAEVIQVVNRVEVVTEPVTREGSSGRLRLVLRIPSSLVASVVRASELGDLDVVAFRRA